MSVDGDASIERKPDFNGTYTLVRNENFDKFLAANGVNWMLRKVVSSVSPNMEVKQDGDKFMFRIYSRVFTKISEFTVGEEYKETQPNGVVMKALARWDGDKVFVSYEPLDANSTVKPQSCIREVCGDELIMTVQIDDIVAKRVFKRIS